MDDRKTFLLEMYRQMFADINRQMTVVWQTVSVVIAAFALLALVEKKIVSLDIATSLIIMLSAWMYANMLDGGYWYNRNIVIIANIERQFLLKTDQKDIQFYFGAHRTTKNTMISYFKIQAYLAIAIAMLVLIFHFSERIFPLPSYRLCELPLNRTFPYITALMSVLLCFFFSQDRQRSYKSFVENSPGIDIDTTGVVYGPGHIVDK